MSLNGCAFVKLLKAEGMGKVLFYFFIFALKNRSLLENGYTSPEILISD